MELHIIRVQLDVQNLEGGVGVNMTHDPLERGTEKGPVDAEGAHACAEGGFAGDGVSELARLRLGFEVQGAVEDGLCDAVEGAVDEEGWGEHG